MDDNNDGKRESWLDVIKRNMKEVPGFKELVKLILYILFILILCIAMIITFNINKNKNKEDDNTQTTTQVVVTYQDMLDNLLQKSNYRAEINVNQDDYIITGSFGNNILIGILENNVTSYKFKIKENNIYELSDSETLNNDLLNNINVGIINNNTLVESLKNNNSIKIDGGYKYHNISINNINYDVEVYIQDDRIKVINVSNNSSSYKLTYDDSFTVD